LVWAVEASAESQAFGGDLSRQTAFATNRKCGLRGGLRGDPEMGRGDGSGCQPKAVLSAVTCRDEPLHDKPRVRFARGFARHWE
jgi:hypothetical protein